MKAGLTASLALALAIPFRGRRGGSAARRFSRWWRRCRMVWRRATADWAMRVTALTNSILRVRIAPRGAFSRRMRAGLFRLSLRRRAGRRSRHPRRLCNGGAPRFASIPWTLRLTVTDAAGKVLIDDAAAAGRHRMAGASRLEKDPAARRAHLTAWATRPAASTAAARASSTGTPTPGVFQRDTDPIYKSIPFYIGSSSSGCVYGLFLDNSWRSWFDFGHRDAGTIEIGSEERADRLLCDRGTHRSRYRPPLHRPDQQGAVAALSGRSATSSPATAT